MAYVIKVNYDNSLRRITVLKSDLFSFAGLESRIRELFKLGTGSNVRVTYCDQDGDIITMADDEDLVDALVKQALNPLRLEVSVMKPKASLSHSLARQGTSEEVKRTQTSVPPHFLDITSESVRQAIASVEPVLKDCLGEVAAAPRQITEIVETVLQSLSKQISSSAKGVSAKGVDVKGVEAKGVEAKGAEEGSRTDPVHGRNPWTSHSTLASARNPWTLHPTSADSARVVIPVTSNPPVRSESSPSLVAGGLPESDGDSSVSQVFHTGVQCDVCGKSPIVGPRYKSIWKHDYDLCSRCFKDVGNVADYNRIDRPLFRPRHFYSPSFGRMRCPAMNPNVHSGRPMSLRGPHGSRLDGRSCQAPVHQMGSNGYAGKMDARFVQDVTIADGTWLAPGTHFTKVWRLRNSGTLPWLPQTKLVHVGGDDFGTVFCVPLELPELGLAPEREVEVAVELVAPEKPGRYVSHWRLASPTGPKFGHRVWVSVQVVPNESLPSDPTVSAGNEEDGEEELSSVESPTLFSNPEFNVSREVFVKTSHAALHEPKITYPSITVAESVMGIEEPFSGLKIGNDVAAMMGIEEPFSGLEIGNDVAAITNHLVPEFKEPEVKLASDAVAVENSELGGGFSMVEMPSNPVSLVNSIPSTPREMPPVVAVENLPEESVGDDVSEVSEVMVSKPQGPEALSAKLEAMGFTDRKLNLELLTRNKLDLRRTLDDLFAAAEWDPILEELEEMGFYDTEMNRRLMFKNNGSVKRVVKELVQISKERAGKGKDVTIE